MKEERLRILLWLSNVQYTKHHQSLSKGLLEGIGSWLLRKPQFLEWRNSSVSSVLGFTAYVGLLYVLGWTLAKWHKTAGSGKTCLM